MRQCMYPKTISVKVSLRWWKLNDLSLSACVILTYSSPRIVHSRIYRNKSICKIYETGDNLILFSRLKLWIDNTLGSVHAIWYFKWSPQLKMVEDLTLNPGPGGALPWTRVHGHGQDAWVAPWIKVHGHFPGPGWTLPWTRVDPALDQGGHCTWPGWTLPWAMVDPSLDQGGPCSGPGWTLPCTKARPAQVHGGACSSPGWTLSCTRGDPALDQGDLAMHQSAPCPGQWWTLP